MKQNRNGEEIITANFGNIRPVGRHDSTPSEQHVPIHEVYDPHGNGTIQVGPRKHRGVEKTEKNELGQGSVPLRQTEFVALETKVHAALAERTRGRNKLGVDGERIEEEPEGRDDDFGKEQGGHHLHQGLLGEKLPDADVGGHGKGLDEILDEDGVDPADEGNFEVERALVTPFAGVGLVGCDNSTEHGDGDVEKRDEIGSCQVHVFVYVIDA
eukprot:CAMPEP_0113314138 /NCGR_PEP_ID=MMETSP0010_2-20120614/10310_1 /TAXON_ID=216773 ORGANISM="Corethron hystrix, Strain 308" /NCGR_SAMPLE_ID=MMETSP0010_2 /ASSEMBLY_ACC=CAM_ASM_000155 /LENGTH=212 /DNA_ID=CAMNT_0000170347 /DNA_START=701 /DNA_END=1339 /DNA_ORIENTATION=- /assembly_acc=CAM_ASM_000155